jgi:hypothetical protein
LDLNDLAEYHSRGELFCSVAEVITLLGAVDGFEADSDGFAAAKNLYRVSVDHSNAFAINNFQLTPAKMVSESAPSRVVSDGLRIIAPRH